jgi:signal transduction histidine kinase
MREPPIRRWGPEGSPEADPVLRRQAIRRGLYRSGTAILVALLISMALALATVLSALEARRANERTREELWRSHCAQATALRLSSKVGRREEGLKAIAAAVDLRASPTLRDEAIATLPLIDLRSPPVRHPLPAEDTVLAASFPRGLVAAGDPRGHVRIRHLADPAPVASLELAGRLMSLEFSPDGRWLAAHAQGGTLVVWDAEEGRVAGRIALPAGAFNEHSLAFSPDGRQLAVCAPGHAVRFYDPATGGGRGLLELDAPPAVAAFDVTGTRLAVGLERRIEVWDPAQARRLQVAEARNQVLDLAWNRLTGQFAVAGNNGDIELVSPGGTTPPLLLRGHTALVNRVLFDPSGSVLVSTSWDGTTRFWSAHSGWPLLVSQAGFARQFDPAGTRILFVMEGIGYGIWELDRGTAFHTLAVPRDGWTKTFGLDFGPDDRWLAVAAGNGVHLVDIRGIQPAYTVPLPWAAAAAFSGDGQSLVIAHAAGIHRVPITLSDGPDGHPFGEPQALMTSPDQVLGRAAITRGARAWLAAGGTSLVACVNLAPPFEVRRPAWLGDGGSLVPSPDGRVLVTSVWKGGGTRVRSLDGEGPPRVLGDAGGIPVFAPDGRSLAVGTGRGFVMYDTADWKPRWEVPRDTGSALSGLCAFHPKGGILATTHTLRQIRLLEVPTGATVATLDAPIPERITALAFSRDGSRLAAATSQAEVQVWNLAELTAALRGLGLDLSATATAAPRTPASPAAAPSGVSRPAAGGRGYEPAAWLSGFGAALALVFAVYAIQHQRRLVRAYEEADRLAEARRREVETAQTHLVHSQKMKALGTLAAGIAHDFNNLLSIIRMSGQLVRRQSRPDGLAARNLDAIERAVGQGKRIVGSILGYSRRPLAPDQSYPVQQVVTDTLAMLHGQYTAGLVVDLQVDPSCPRVTGDRTRLEQVLLNFIVNAHEAMQGSGCLTLSVRNLGHPGATVLAPRPAAAYVEIEVRDTGAGIDPQTLPRIFEPFFTTKTAGHEPGTGLGLTTVYAIARRDGFGLGVESECGRGTAFRVIVPVDGPSIPP